MLQNNHKIIGILGGMGPAATASFYNKVIQKTAVEKDQDHFRIIIDSNPNIPDRTKAILYNGKNPVPELIKTGQNLEVAGATEIVIPCFTAHYYFDEIQSQINIPIVHIYEELYRYLKSKYGNVQKVGVLCTTGTKNAGMFTRELRDFDVIYPDAATQENSVMKAIYGDNGIKQGNTGLKPKKLLQKAAKKLIDSGAKIIVSGCTEIELALKPEDVTVPLIDPMEIVAESVTI